MAGAGTGPSPAHAATYMAPQPLLKAVVSAAVTAAEEVANRCALSATFMAKHHAFCVLLGDGDHWKGMPSLSHVELVVGYRSVVADGARKVSVCSVQKAVARSDARGHKGVYVHAHGARLLRLGGWGNGRPLSTCK